MDESPERNRWDWYEEEDRDDYEAERNDRPINKGGEEEQTQGKQDRVGQDPI